MEYEKTESFEIKGSGLYLLTISAREETPEERVERTYNTTDDRPTIWQGMLKLHIGEADREVLEQRLGDKFLNQLALDSYEGLRNDARTIIRIKSEKESLEESVNHCFKIYHQIKESIMDVSQAPNDFFSQLEKYIQRFDIDNLKRDPFLQRRAKDTPEGGYSTKITRDTKNAYSITLFELGNSLIDAINSGDKDRIEDIRLRFKKNALGYKEVLGCTEEKFKEAIERLEQEFKEKGALPTMKSDDFLDDIIQFELGSSLKDIYSITLFELGNSLIEAINSGDKDRIGDIRLRFEENKEGYQKRLGYTKEEFDSAIERLEQKFEKKGSLPNMSRHSSDDIMQIFIDYIWKKESQEEEVTEADTAHVYTLEEQKECSSLLFEIILEPLSRAIKEKDKKERERLFEQFAFDSQYYKEVINFGEQNLRDFAEEEARYQKQKADSSNQIPNPEDSGPEEDVSEIKRKSFEDYQASNRRSLVQNKLRMKFFERIYLPLDEAVKEGNFETVEELRQKFLKKEKTYRTIMELTPEHFEGFISELEKKHKQEVKKGS